MKRIYIALGAKVKFRGKHGICKRYKFGDCKRCILKGTKFCASKVIPCESYARTDGNNVYFLEVK